MTKKTLSTYDRFIQDPICKKKLDESYHEFLLSEFILALMEEDYVSARKLAEEAKLSPSIIQDLCSEKNLTLKSFLKTVSYLGYHIELKKSKKN